jgi:3-mercaptopyruvate sulfurtransferase SseA
MKPKASYFTKKNTETTQNNNDSAFEHDLNKVSNFVKIMLKYGIAAKIINYDKTNSLKAYYSSTCTEYAPKIFAHHKEIKMLHAQRPKGIARSPVAPP